MKSLSTSSNRSAFSLIEMLMSIAVLAIMTAIAMAAFGNTAGVNQAKDQRNAQNFCTLYAAVDAAGMHLIQDGVSKEDVMRALRSGVIVESGTFKGRTFRLPNIDESDLIAAGRFLEIRDGQLIYQAMGSP